MNEGRQVNGRPSFLRNDQVPVIAAVAVRYVRARPASR